MIVSILLPHSMQISREENSIFGLICSEKVGANRSIFGAGEGGVTSVVFMGGVGKEVQNEKPASLGKEALLCDESLTQPAAFPQ